MSTPPKQPAKPKKIQVIVGKQVLAETDSLLELEQVIFSLKEDHCLEFKVVKHVAKSCFLYSKSIQEKNYKITEVEYVAPSKPVADDVTLDK